MDSKAGVRELSGFVSFLTGCSFRVHVEVDELGAANVEVRGSSIAAPQSQIYVGAGDPNVLNEKMHMMLMIGLFEKLAADYRTKLDSNDSVSIENVSPTTTGGTPPTTVN